MLQVEVIPTPATTFLSAPQGFDFDQDGRREFILRKEGENGLFEFYESVTDNTFALVHVLDLENNPNDSYYPAYVGDSDDDGLAELVVLAKDWVGPADNEYGTRVYESESTNAYPTKFTWGVVTALNGWSLGGLIADTDLDGKQEIVTVEPAPGSKLVVYENDGDDSYVQTYSFEPLHIGTRQSAEILSDVDDDGRDEILPGGIGTDNIVAFESTGDDTYELVWAWDAEPTISVQFIVDAGDLDNDGRKEFLAGGLKPNQPLDSRLHVFEAVADNDFQIVATLIRPNSVEAYSSANIADVDGDGRKEIVFGTAWSVAIYENTGDNAWSEIWSEDWQSEQVGPLQSIGAGDHDADGKDEVILNHGGWTNGFTVVWEIFPLYAADLDSDGVVDAIDNCLLTWNPGQEDSDSDTVGNACDNCIYGPNPEQGPAIFGQEILALDSETLSWAEPAEIDYVRGDLELVDMYIVDVFETLPLGTSFDDPIPPNTGEGVFYLVKPDCAVGSWQTTLGAEPDRDTELP